MDHNKKRTTRHTLQSEKLRNRQKNTASSKEKIQDKQNGNKFPKFKLISSGLLSVCEPIYHHTLWSVPSMRFMQNWGTFKIVFSSFHLH